MSERVRLIDRFLPDWHFAERHSVTVAASPAAVERAAHAVDIGSAPVVRLLLRLRGMRADALRLAEIERAGFRRLAHEPEREIVLGLIGRFWTVGGGLCRYDAAEFAAFDQPGWAKAAWNFHMSPLGDGATRLTTETRIYCTDARSRRRFRAYWFLIRPFSGLIRRLALRAIKRAAESADSR